MKLTIASPGGDSCREGWKPASFFAKPCPHVGAWPIVGVWKAGQVGEPCRPFARHGHAWWCRELGDSAPWPGYWGWATGASRSTSGGGLRCAQGARSRSLCRAVLHGEVSVSTWADDTRGGVIRMCLPCRRREALKGAFWRTCKEIAKVIIVHC